MRKEFMVMKQTLRKWPTNNQSNLRPVPTSNTIKDTLLFLQLGSYCPLRGYTQKLTQPETDTYNKTLDGTWGLIE